MASSTGGFSLVAERVTSPREQSGTSDVERGSTLVDWLEVLLKVKRSKGQPL